MAETSALAAAAPASDRAQIAQRFALAAILALSAFLNLYRLDQIGMNGIGNPYYAAAVQSMLTSAHNWFYLSVDPAGFVSLDKPPLAFWIQAASARLLGFRGLSLLLPEAIAGILSVYVLYRLVRRTQSEWASLLAALTLAVTPISVVTQRNNAPDALLVLVLLLAAWALLRAVAQGSQRWLVLTAILVGIAFNVKMLQMLLIVPALVVFYLAAAPWSWRIKLANACVAILVALLVSAPWVIAVELTPPAQRPYIGGSLNNTVTDLIFSYNGIARLWGEDFTYFSGAPGPVRLFNDKLGGQVSWLLPFALVGLIVSAWQVRPSRADTRARRHALALWTTWLFVQVIYFSIATFFHRYYLATLAPAIAALVGLGADAPWTDWHEGGRKRVLVVIAPLLCGGIKAILLLPFPDWSPRLIPPIELVYLVSAAILLWAWRTGRPGETWQRAAFIASLLTLQIAPLVWTFIPVFSCTDYTLPYGGPQVVGPPKDCKRLMAGLPFLHRAWVEVFERGRNGARFLAATHDMGIAELGLLETREPFMALGGFRGRDPILTVEQFAERVARGEVRFYTAMEDKAEFPVQEGVRHWVKEHCPPVRLDDTAIFIWGPCEARSP